MDNKFKFVFLGATHYSKKLLIFLLEKKLIPEVIFSIPQEFSISYSKDKVKNTNYADLEKIAIENAIPYREIDSIEGKRLIDYKLELEELRLDLILVLGWYYMIPESIRRVAKYGAWGIHASLLPKYAGGAPLNWAIINGEKEAGVSLFRMDDGVDDGDIISQKAFSIEYKDSIKNVYDKATLVSKEILMDTLTNLDQVVFTKQDKSKIEVYPQRKPEDGEINWQSSSQEIYNFIRAQTLPYPCAFSFVRGSKLKIIDGDVVNIDSSNYQSGKIVEINNKALVATKDKFIQIGYVQDEKRQYKFKDYARINDLWGGGLESKKS